MITSIKTPNYFDTIDNVDIEREVIGLIWEKKPDLYGVPITILGVRKHGAYYSSNDTHWSSLTTSREIRRPGWVVDVKYERA